MSRARRAAPTVLVAGLLLLAGLWGLGAASPWWDEGWTLSVARTWVERGFYGRLQLGQPAAPGLEAAFPVTDLVALSFRLFGVGVWQGRLPIVLCAVGALALMFELARRLHGRAAAWATLALLLLPPHGQLNGLLMGRQVLAELPMLCYLLAGYASLLLALRRPIAGLPLAIVCLALGLLAKLQAVPFVLVSLLLPLALLLLQRRWRPAAILAAALAGAWFGGYALVAGQRALVAGHTLPPVALPGLVSVTALVPSLALRPVVLRTVLVYALPQLLGIAVALWQFAWRERLRLDSPAAIVRCALLLFAASWMAWFAGFSIGWIRYLLPATFVGSLFAGELLARLSGGSPRAAIGRVAAALRARRPNRPALGGLLALALLAALLPSGVLALGRGYAAPDGSAMQAAAFLNTQTPPGARIETYETELHFLLDRPYHFPPDQVHVAIDQRVLLGRDVPLGYDPLALAPDYVVVGLFGQFSGLYNAIISDRSFRLIRRDGVYEIYERIRG